MKVAPVQPFAPRYRRSAPTVVSQAVMLSHLLEAADGAPMLAAVRAPFLAVYGGREPSAVAKLATILHQAANAAHIATETIASADHFYAGQETAVAGVVARRISTLAGAEPPLAGNG